MPLPTSYSEANFAAYLASQIDPITAALGWDAGSVQVMEAMNDALLDQGVSSIASVTTATDIRALRAFGRRAIWRAVVQATAGDYSITDSDHRLDRQQVNEHARLMLEFADNECRALGIDTSWAASVVAVSRPHDPYGVFTDEARALP